jgi:hypothetical protein
MACIRTYYGNDLKPSILFQQLVDRFGESRGEQMYLLSKSREIKTDRTVQGEPTIDAVLNANLQEANKSKRSVTDIHNNLVASRAAIDYKDDVHTYAVNGKQLDSVSIVTDKDVPYTGSKPTDFDYAEEGTRYHGALEDIINGVLTNDEIIAKRQLSENETAFLLYMRTFVSRLKKNGKVIPELRVALTKSEIAGSIDIVHIKNDGKVDIYDLKTVFESPGRKKAKKKLWDIFAQSGSTSNYKAQRYSLQTSYYKYILENTDEATGRQGVEVDNVYILPIEVLMDDNKVIEGIVPRAAENIQEWKKGNVNFGVNAEKKVRARIGVADVSDIALKGYDTPTTLPDFINTILPKESITDEDLHRKALRYVEDGRNEDGFRIRGSFYRWEGKSKEEKLAKVKSVLTGYEDGGGADLVRAAVLTFQGAPGGYFTSNEKAANQLKRHFDTSNAKKVFALSDIEGFENYKDILVLQREDGSSDLVKMTYENLRRKITIANPYANPLAKYLTGISGSILGNYMTYDDAKSKGITLQNDLTDKEQLRMALIAMELKNANKDFYANRVVVQSFASNDLTIPRSVLLDKLLPQVKAIYNVPEIKNAAAGRIKNILDNEELYNAESYEVDPAVQYLDFLRNNLKSEDFIDPETDKKNVRYMAMKALEYTVNGEMQKDELVKILISYEEGIKNLIGSKYQGTPADVYNKTLTDPEFQQLARTVITLTDGKLYPEKDVSEGFMGDFMKYLVTPTKTGRLTLDRAIDHMRKGLDTVKNEITKFTQEKKPVFEALRDTDPIWKAGIKIGGRSALSTDTFFGMGQSVFEPLFQKRKKADGSTYKIPFLITEETAEFRKLAPAQQKFITWFNDTVEKWYKEAHPYKNAKGIRTTNWVRGMIPVLTTSPNTSLYQAKDSVLKGDLRKATQAMKNFGKRSYQMLGNYGNFVSPDKTNDRLHIYDFFKSQVNDIDGTASIEALDAVGLDENMNLVDPQKNMLFETDLEEVVNQFMAHNVKKREMDKALPLGRMYQSIFHYYAQAHALKQTDSIRLLDNFINDNVFGEKIGAESEISKIINTGVGLSSIMLLGLNWKVFTANGMQQGLNSLVQTMTTQFSGDKRFPGFKANGKAFTELSKMSNPVNGFEQARKVDMLLEYYMPEDITQLKTRRYKVTQKGIIDTQSAFALDRIIERGLRAHYLIAQMIQDGTYDAHSVERYTGKDGYVRYRIKYDERKDERFKKDPKLKQAIKESLATHGELEGDENDNIETKRMTKAYDWRLRQKYKSYADQMFSSFDKDLKSDIAHYGMFSGFTQFRSWFRDKFVKGTKREYENMITGDYTLVEDGKYIWSNEEFKGVFWTLLDIGSISKNVIKNKSFKEVSKSDKQNLLLAGNSMAMWALLAALIGAAFGDDDDPSSILAEAVLMRGIQDLTSMITMGPLFNVLDDPFIFASYYKNVYGSVINSLGYAVDGDISGVAGEIMKMTPLVRDFV